MITNNSRYVGFVMAVIILSTCAVLYINQTYKTMFPEQNLAEMYENLSSQYNTVNAVESINTQSMQNALASLSLVLNVAVLLVINLITFISMRFLMIKKTSHIGDKEVRNSVLTVIGSTVVAYVLSLIITGLTFAGYALLFILQMPFCCGLIYVLPLYLRYKNAKRESYACME